MTCALFLATRTTATVPNAHGPGTAALLNWGAESWSEVSRGYVTEPGRGAHGEEPDRAAPCPLRSRTVIGGLVIYHTRRRLHRDTPRPQPRQRQAERIVNSTRRRAEAARVAHRSADGLPNAIADLPFETSSRRRADQGQHSACGARPRSLKGSTPLRHGRALGAARGAPGFGRRSAKRIVRASHDESSGQWTAPSRGARMSTVGAVGAHPLEPRRESGIALNSAGRTLRGTGERSK